MKRDTSYPGITLPDSRIYASQALQENLALYSQQPGTAPRPRTAPLSPQTGRSAPRNAAPPGTLPKFTRTTGKLQLPASRPFFLSGDGKSGLAYGLPWSFWTIHPAGGQRRRVAITNNLDPPGPPARTAPTQSPAPGAGKAPKNTARATLSLFQAGTV